MRLQEVMLLNSAELSGPDKSQPSKFAIDGNRTLLALSNFRTYKLPVEIRADEHINGALSRT